MGGFIGSNFVLAWLSEVGTGHQPRPALDLLTYAGNPANLESLHGDPGAGDIATWELVSSLLRDHRPLAIVRIAAESQVDRSIVAPDAFYSDESAGAEQSVCRVQGRLGPAGAGLFPRLRHPGAHDQLLE
ncbi:MAG TPA: GDP-mannose 4,6-dehydratase [Acidobacteriaceae bacterium]|nr:GDP-mannose 4,6-dehydratase [Acidobacteriaceae bacterium]